MRERVSVVVCTFNRCDSLDDSLKSLQAMTVPENIDWDLVIVDNKSTDGTRSVIEKFSANAEVNVKYVFEPIQGLSHARNRGVLSTESEYIAFTDDDVLVKEDWLASIVEAFATSGADCVGGKIIPHWLGERPRWLSDNLMNILAMLDHGDKTLELDLKHDDRILYGANFAFRRASLIKAGLFNVGLGRKGDSGAGEDKEILEKLSLIGGKIIYHPKVTVLHKVPPERLNKAYFRKWCYVAGRDRATITRDCRFTVFGIESYLFREFIQTSVNLSLAVVGLKWDRAFEHELRWILYLSVFRHKLAMGKFNPWAKIGESTK